MSSVSEDSYWPPLGPPPSSWLHREGAAASKDAIYPTVKPPQRYSTDWFVLFVPSLRHLTSLDTLNTPICSIQLSVCYLFPQVQHSRGVVASCDSFCNTIVPKAVIKRALLPLSESHFQPMFCPRYCPTSNCSSWQLFNSLCPNVFCTEDHESSRANKLKAAHLGSQVTDLPRESAHRQPVSAGSLKVRNPTARPKVFHTPLLLL